MKFSKKLITLGLTLVMVSSFSGCSKKEEQPQANSGDTIDFKIMATTDVHDYLMNYDYYTTSDSDDYGLVKINTIINKYKDENGKKGDKDIDNLIVLDNGDLIQGNPLGDYFAKVNPVKKGETHPVYKALEICGYDGATLGNHEFNYGLDFLNQIISDTKVPIVNANIYNAETNKPEFEQYKIITEKVVDESGKEHEIKIGITGFVPPQIMSWDKLNLEGKITVKDIKESAEEIVPKIKEEGADIIVALAHSGYGDGTYKKGNENEAYELTKIKDIDALVVGHSHDIFPVDTFTEGNDKLENVDVKKGTINGKATVQPSKYAEGIGVIYLKLKVDGDKYTVVDSSSEYITAKDVENNEEFSNALKADHEKVISYVNSPVGKTTQDINTYFALVSDSNTTQLISDAQLEYAKSKVLEESELNEYKNLPILSAAAPFKAGLSKDGTKSDDYVDISKGDLSIKDTANIYKYPNTAVIMKLNGKDIKNWLEMTAGMFNTIDPNKSDAQELLNKNYPAFNFDTIDGLTYEIDVTQKPKYNENGEEINKDSTRIANLKYQDKDIKDSDEFLVITNNYRASGGGNFPIFEGNDKKVIFTSSDETRQIIIDYIKSKGTIDPKADNNWKIKTVTSKAKPVFLSNDDAEEYLNSYPAIKKSSDKDNDLSEFEYDLNK